MKKISLIRFNALSGYARHPKTVLTAEELGYFEHADERILGVLIRDKIDNDFAGVILARDELMQYRCTDTTDFHHSVRWAKAWLRQKMEQAALAPNEEHYQGHQNHTPVDFFTPIVSPEQLNPNFRTLTESHGWRPARGIIEPMMRWYKDADGNFVQQFQTTGFDARLWELYLFATLVEMGFVLDRDHNVPDFIASGIRGSIAIEAVTVNPSRDRYGAIIPPPSTDNDKDIEIYLHDYMPIRFSSALTTKLYKEYWKEDKIRGIPFTIAIQDFSSPNSTVITRPALALYLYGYEYLEQKIDGIKKLIPKRIPEHIWNTKRIPSGFFFLPGAENAFSCLDMPFDRHGLRISDVAESAGRYGIRHEGQGAWIRGGVFERHMCWILHLLCHRHHQLNPADYCPAAITRRIHVSRAADESFR